MAARRQPVPHRSNIIAHREMMRAAKQQISFIRKNAFSHCGSRT